MTTKEATQAMLEGKKVRPVDENVAYFEHCYFDGVGFIDHNKDYFDFNYWVSKYTTWEIYEEHKPKKVVVIEKWLCKSLSTSVTEYFFEVCSSNIDSYILDFGDNWTKEKLLDTYEEEL